MEATLLKDLSRQLQRARRTLVEEVADNDESFRGITESRESELEEQAQQERDSRALKGLDERAQARLRDIDDALARIESGTYGNCANCGNPIDEERLRSTPTTIFCAECAKDAEKQSGRPEEDSEDTLEAGRLPPDLDQLDDEELEAHLSDLVREDGQIEMEELQIRVRNRVVYLEGAVPSEPEHEVLLNVLTDVAGIQDIIDRLEVQRLAWEREDRSKNQTAEDVQPGTIPDTEPYGGTEDIILTREEGVTYEPPEIPPPPPHRKD